MEVNDSSQFLDVSPEGLASLRNILHSSKTGAETLTHRRVMIPITTKAFFEGELLPTMRHNTIDKNKDEEQVMMNIGKGYLADMTIDEATCFIDRRLKALRPLGAKVKKVTKMKLKKGFLQPKKPKSAVKKSKTVQPTSQSMSTLPFMEIREEYDEDGIEVKSETTNISKVLHNVKNEIQNKQGREESKDEMLNALLRGVSDNSDMNDNVESDIEEEEDDDHDTNEEHELPKARPHSEISARLDELIRLEEESELNKKVNTRSSKKLQGTGWKKGFLSNVSNGRTANKKNEMNSVRAKQAPLTTNKDHSKDRKVQFRPSHAVKEIPRIGTRSVKPSTHYPEIENLSSSLEQTVLSTTTQNRPSKSVSIGGVTERPGLKSTLHQNSETDSYVSTKSSVEPEKKLSRFAQRRQQQKY